MVGKTPGKSRNVRKKAGAEAVSDGRPRLSVRQPQMRRAMAMLRCRPTSRRCRAGKSDVGRASML